MVMSIPVTSHTHVRIILGIRNSKHEVFFLDERNSSSTRTNTTLAIDINENVLDYSFLLQQNGQHLVLHLALTGKYIEIFYFMLPFLCDF